MEVFNITPNPAKTMESLRYLTYSNESALADIVDNSFDAGAERVDIKIDKGSITITDDGSGMSLETLKEAIKLGSDTDKDKDPSKLGRFGMGLVTASISMARKVTVASRTGKDEVNCVCLDLDKIAETGQWAADKIEISPLDKWLLDDYDHGTIVRLENIDRLKYKDINTLINKVKSHFGEVFRKFLNAGRILMVNGKAVEPIDPLALNDPATNILLDEDVTYKDDRFHITLVEIDSESSRLATNNSRNPRSQGFYIVRNNRQIARALLFGGIKRHGNLNRFRCEISYASELDDCVGINFTKDNIVIDQSLEDAIMEKTRMGIRIITQNAIRRQADHAANAEMDHSDAEKIIQSKKSLLPNPRGWQEKHNKRSEQDKASVPDQNGDNAASVVRKRTRAEKTQLGYRGLNARFEQAKNGSSSPLFDYINEGSDIVIQWNVDHPFYMKFVAPFNNDKDVSSPIDLLAFSISLAEYQVAEDDEQNEKLLQLREEYSRILRTLMG